MKAIEVELISLRARRERAGQYRMNKAMQIEGTLLDAQIEALEKASKPDPNAVTVTYEQPHLESGEITGEVIVDGEVRDFEFGWGSHEAYWGDQVNNQYEDEWYGGIVEEISDAVRQEFEKRHPNWDMDECHVKADLVYNDEGITITDFTAEYAE